MVLDRLSVKSRFMLVLVIGFVCQTCITLASLVHLKHSLLQARTAEVKHLLETAYSTVAFYHDQAAKGILTDAAAQTAARVRTMAWEERQRSRWSLGFTVPSAW
jgi:hypothetical protein